MRRSGQVRSALLSSLAIAEDLFLSFGIPERDSPTENDKETFALGNASPERAWSQFSLVRNEESEGQS